MKSEFVQPRFEGARFTEHTLPLDVVKDLAAYEALLIEFAKYLYLKEHPERQRVPKGFAADFHLHLERVDDGCARPLLSLVTAGALALGLGAGPYFEQARELITECIASPEGQLPPEFPKELLVHFNQIGRSLGPDERMEIAAANGQTAVLTPERRKHLVLAADTVYERPIELTGSIIEAHWEKSSFQLRPRTGQPIVVPMPESFHAQARKYGGRSRHQVLIIGIGAYDSWENLVKVVSVDSLEIQPDYQLANRFEELRGVQDGWHDGQEQAPDREKLDIIASRLIGHYPEKAALPVIIPTPEGNLLFEWNAAGDPSMDVELSTLQADVHAFQADGGDMEGHFDLSKTEEWPKMFALITQITGQPAA
jgi:hypothetical protein